MTEQSDEPSSGRKSSETPSEVSIIPPYVVSGGNLVGRDQSIRSLDRQAVEAFLQSRAEVHQTYIREEQATKRLNLVIASVLIVVAMLILIFAPEGRETLSYWIGGALVIVAAGAAGYKRIWGKTSSGDFGGDQ